MIPRLLARTHYHAKREAHLNAFVYSLLCCVLSLLACFYELVAKLLVDPLLRKLRKTGKPTSRREIEKWLA